MPEQNDKVFVGVTRLKEFDWGSFTQVGLTKDDLTTLSKYINDRGFVNINVKEARNGKPYVEVDTWGFDVEKEAPIAKPADEDSLPF